MKRLQWGLFSSGALLLCVILMSPGTVWAQGIMLNGIGPVNRSMGGASTAAPIDAAGAIYWNPASISGLAKSEVMFGMDLLLPTENISSQVGAGAFGPGVPPVPLSGSTGGEPGACPIPVVAWVHKPVCSRWTYGLGMYGIAGFRANYPASTTNPILTPQPAAGGLGFGQLFSEAEFLQIVPTVAYAISDNLSIGVSPTITMGRIAFDPLAIASPVGGLYTSGRGTRYSWGGGVQAGLYYIGRNSWNWGLSIKSPQWMEDFRFITGDGAGGSRVAKFDLDLPMIISFGGAYTGIQKCILACDIRYFDYKNAPGFGDPAGFDGTGAVTGLGWDNIFSVSGGMQYQASDNMYLRMGYTFQQDPINGMNTFFNVACPLIIEHLVSVGASYRLTARSFLSVTYVHGFENAQTGPYHAAGVGPVPSTSVTNTVSADVLSLGFTVRY